MDAIVLLYGNAMIFTDHGVITLVFIDNVSAIILLP